jgi:Raf kinase inhibitor-like YbhB/YbcL family protein
MKGVILFLVLYSNLGFGKSFKLSSYQMRRGMELDKKFSWNYDGCEGENISPELHWENIPKGTQSFALTVFNPDVKSGSGWWHWQVINIPKEATKINQNSSLEKNLPIGSLEIKNDYGLKGWGGPCPPPGETHHLIFSLYALKTKRIESNELTTPAQIGLEIEKYKLKKSSLRVKFSR